MVGRGVRGGTSRNFSCQTLPLLSASPISILAPILTGDPTMRPSVALIPLFTLLTGLGVFAGWDTRPSPATVEHGPAHPRVKLAVLVVFDQMRGDYPEKWKPLFGPDGFARLQSEGACFTRCYYPYGTTTTGPGHASILSGTCPDRHGIVNNNWYENGKDVYCAGSVRYTNVPTLPKFAVADEDTSAKKAESRSEPKTGGTPERLLSETIADVLKQTHGPRAKVFGLSLKDRSAILPTGRHPDGAFWFDGRFVTSTYYTEHLDRSIPGWVSMFNASKAADAWFGKDWTRFRPDLDYAALSGPDIAPGEGIGIKQGKTFPHPTSGGLKTVGKAYYEALANSPYGNELLLSFMEACVTAEGLGRDDTPDLLVVSFSSNDLIGHSWGPDSQEVLDVTLRSDVIVARLLRFLDTKVGKGNYVLALTADHGICPLPEASAARGVSAQRVNQDALRADAEKHLRTTFGSGGDGGETTSKKAASGWIEAVSPPWFYLNPRLVAASGRPREEVARSLADYLLTRSDVARAFTRADLAQDASAGDEIGQRVRRSYYPDRCGDVYLVGRPFDLLVGKANTTTGTTHGSPYAYDAYVPLMVYGPGIPGGPRTEPVTPQATAAIFAQFLGLRLPNAAEFPVPATLEGK